MLNALCKFGERADSLYCFLFSLSGHAKDFQEQDGESGTGL